MSTDSNQSQEYQINRQSFGQDGAQFLSHVDDICSKRVCAILVIEDAVLHANTIWKDFTDGTSHLKGDTASITIPAGVTIYGQFSQVRLDSGSVLCYLAA